MNTDLFAQAKPGDYVAYDPTGRDLADCLEVGRVTARVSSVHRAGGEVDEGPFLEVLPNGSASRIRVERIAAIVEENTRLCRFCGDGVTSTNPAVDFCTICFYTGRAFSEKMEPAVVFIREQLAELVDPESVGVWHTGGGCFCVGASLVNGGELLLSDAESGLPMEADSPLMDAVWAGWLCRNAQETDEQGGVLIPDDGDAAPAGLAWILERVKEELSDRSK